MDEATILEGTEYVAVSPMETAALWAAWGKRKAEIARLNAERLSLHLEITKREHADQAARLNQDKSLDQVVRSK
jgi:hypothetical protein